MAAELDVQLTLVSCRSSPQGDFLKLLMPMGDDLIKLNILGVGSTGSPLPSSDLEKAQGQAEELRSRVAALEGERRGLREENRKLAARLNQDMVARSALAGMEAARELQQALNESRRMAEEEVEEARCKAERAGDEMSRRARREIDKLKKEFLFLLSNTESDLAGSRTETRRLRHEVSVLRKRLSLAAGVCLGDKCHPGWDPLPLSQGGFLAAADPGADSEDHKGPGHVSDLGAQEQLPVCL